MDQFWWWWVIHLWIEATWEVFVGTLAAYALIKIIGAKREIVANAFGNFLGAGVWGFFHTLPQVNIYTHGTQFTAAHGHLAFFGAYAAILIGMMYMGIQGAYGIERMKATFKSKMGIFLIVFGVLGMGVALTIAGYEQVLVERAELGGGWNAFFAAQELPWYVQAQLWRTIMGVVTFVGFVYLVWDLLTIGKQARQAQEI